VTESMPSDRSHDDSFDALKVKHLEFIQAVVTRMGNNGFLLKGWALTVGAAFFGFAAREVSWSLATVGLLPVVTFWALDAYFLHRERLFRHLYNAVVRGDPPVERFAMDYRMFLGPGCRYRHAATSLPLLCFYGSLATAGVVLIALTALHHGT
jgi:hypothetical protein